MANIKNDKPNTPKGSQMHKRFERDGERLKKKFIILSKRTMTPGIENGENFAGGSAIVPNGT